MVNDQKPEIRGRGADKRRLWEHHPNPYHNDHQQPTLPAVHLHSRLTINKKKKSYPKRDARALNVPVLVLHCN